MAGVDERGMPRVLIADDDQSIEVLGAMLQYANYKVEYARDGQEVLKLWISRRYHLILMDVGMSPMDGLTASVIIRMKEQALGGYTPIIALTAETTEESRRNCFAAGMDGYVPKPVIFKDLVHLMQEILGEKEGVPVEIAARPPVQHQPVPEYPYRAVFWRGPASAVTEVEKE